MPDTFMNMMSMLTMLHSSDSRTYALAIETALSRPQDRNSETLIASLIRSKQLPDEYLQRVLNAEDPNVRRIAWTECAHTLPVEVWNTVGHREDDDSVLEPLRRSAPLTKMSLEGISALFDVPAGKLTRPQARTVVENPFRPGMEDMWRRALLNLPPGRVPDSVVRKGYTPVVDGHVADLLPGTPAIYRVAAACAMRAEPGTLAALVDAEPNIGTELSNVFEAAESLFRGRLASCLVNRHADLMSFHDLRVTSYGYSLQPMTQRERQAFESTPDQQLLTMDTVTGSTVKAVPEAYHLAWDRLADEYRTDLVCAYLLDSDIGHPLHVKIVEHLGDRALEVVAQHKLTELSRYSDPKKWWPLVDLGAWVGAMRYATLADIRQHLEDADETMVKYLAADLLADPSRWLDTAGAGVAMAAGFGPDELMQLTFAQVARVGWEHPESRPGISDALAAATHLNGLAAREGAIVMADSTARFVDVLAATKALA